MFMTDAEISLLRLCAWCKDLPNDSAFLNTKDLGSLLLTKLLYYSRNGQSIRLTDSGREILQSIGYVYEKDNTVRSVGTRLTKRLNTSNLMLFFFGGKTDVFCSSVPDRNSPLSFLPSFALRREKNKNPLGTARFNGMLYTKNTARAVYYITEKAEFYEMYSGFLNSRGYTVKAYNLLDLFASDGWNCVMDTAQDITLVQRAAEIIIRNTSNENERGDFWEKAEKNLLMALLHYVQTLTYPGTDKLLPPEERSLGTIYKILSTTSVQELGARFRALPPDHPALPPYGIFRQAHKQIWGNIVIGLGNRLNVFQNKLVDDITKHNEIDLTLPGREKCAYFCIISDQDSSLEFLSSMFFSLMFVKLFDYARQQDNRRLPVCVNVLMDEFCNIALLDSKKIFSVARSRNINIQAVVQSIAQLSDRYPGNEWQEIVGDCDYQLFLGCNDVMTSEFFSKQCGEITVRVNNTNTPMRPFLDFLSPQKSYMQNKTSTGGAYDCSAGLPLCGKGKCKIHILRRLLNGLTKS